MLDIDKINERLVEITFIIEHMKNNKTKEEMHEKINEPLSINEMNKNNFEKQQYFGIMSGGNENLLDNDLIEQANNLI